jgi:hypothetical protein
VAEVYLAISGIPAITILPGLPTEEVLELVQIRRPKALGFSVALPTQMKQVREMKEHLESLPYRPQRTLVGGPALRLDLHPDPSFRFDICRNLSDMVELLAWSRCSLRSCFRDAEPGAAVAGAGDPRCSLAAAWSCRGQ